MSYEHDADDYQDDEPERDYVQELKDEMPAREEPDEPPTDAEWHHGQYTQHTSEAERLARLSDGGKDPAWALVTAVQAQTRATLAAAAATMYAAASAEEVALRARTGATASSWPTSDWWRGHMDDVLLGEFGSFETGCDMALRCFFSKYPDHAGAQFAWEALSLGSFRLLMNGHPTEVSLTRVVDESPF
jgi:hypothetical protein